MNICIISLDYPNKKSSTFSFVKQFVNELACQGHQCYVLSPFSVTKYKCLTKVFECNKNESGGSVTIIRPNYLSFSSIKFCHLRLTSIFFKRAVKRAFTLLPIVPDIVYGHFWSAAYCGYEYAKKHNIPLFVASGESSIVSLFQAPQNKTEFCNYVSGVICVSTKNRDESIANGLTVKEKCIVLPNAVDNKLFFKQNKKKCREKYDFPKEAFVIAFLGWFNNRKGCLRVSDAIDLLHDRSICSIFIGNGPDNPRCSNILFKGGVPHERICSLLNCADVFVLPTLQEGCCNAIIEAMACGLPIISSNLPFNWDVLNEENSILVNPENISEIAHAIKELRDNHCLRKKMAENAERSACQLNIQIRTKKIISFIESQLCKKRQE